MNQNCCSCFAVLDCSTSYKTDLAYMIDDGPNTVTLAEMFEECTGLSGQILCFICQDTLQSFYKFRKRAVETAKLLSCAIKEMLKSSGTNLKSEDHFVYSDDIVSSVSERHSQEKKNYICEICGKKYEALKTLKNHILVKHVGRHRVVKQQVFDCIDCTKRFMTKRSFNLHLAKVHGKGQILKPFSCSICNSKWRTKYELLGHSKTHNNLKEYECHFCEKRFKTKCEVKTHLEAVHKGEMNFICEVCGGKFKTLNSLQCHRLNHRKGNRYRCSICSATFRQASTLSEHRRNHKDTQKGIVFECCHCGKVTKTRVSLQHHLKLHRGADIPCSQCHKVYKNNDSLKRHFESVHNGLKPRQQCTICDKKLWNKHKILDHIRGHHPEIVDNPEKFVRKIFIKSLDESNK